MIRRLLTTSFLFLQNVSKKCSDLLGRAKWSRNAAIRELIGIINVQPSFG
jgi:hypothetical protein